MAESNGATGQTETLESWAYGSPVLERNGGAELEWLAPSDRAVPYFACARCGFSESLERSTGRVGAYLPDLDTLADGRHTVETCCDWCGGWQTVPLVIFGRTLTAAGAWAGESTPDPFTVESWADAVRWEAQSR